jgi:hypothetical protein
LIRQKPGDLPWLVRALMRYMAPVQVVPVIGMGNALWRLGHERFDAVLVDVPVTDQAVIERCREQIADIAAVPVLNLHDKPGMANAAEQRSRPDHRRQPRAVASIDHHEVARLPWERRAKRQARRAEREAASVA